MACPYGLSGYLCTKSGVGEIHDANRLLFVVYALYLFKAGLLILSYELNLSALG